jgi:flagellin-like hook-associated protein FlgL
MADISLTAGIRSNLLSLQGTSDLLNQTQARLGSGKKVNSPIDNPTAYFTAQALSNRAGDLTARLDGIAKGIQTVKAANAGVSSLTDLLKQAKGVAQDARSLSTATTADADRSAAAVKYNTLMTQIDQLAKDSGYDGVNLLKSDSLTVQFAEKAGSSTLALTGFSGASGGTVITAATQTAANWKGAGSLGNSAIDVEIGKIETSISNLQNQSKTLSSNLGVLTTRQTFVKTMADTLTTGADDLTNADLNTEAANLLALNTRQQLGVNALSLASQASQSVLKLLG